MERLCTYIFSNKVGALISPFDNTYALLSIILDCIFLSVYIYARMLIKVRELRQNPMDRCFVGRRISMVRCFEGRQSPILKCFVGRKSPIVKCFI